MNQISGTTDVLTNSGVVPSGIKSICIVGALAAGSSLTAGVVTPITSTDDASTKFGATSKVPKLVKVLIDNGITFIKGIAVEAIGGEVATKAVAYERAFQNTLTDSSIKIMLVDDQDSTVIPKLSAHLDIAEAEGLRRYGFVGTTTGKTVAEIGTLASGYNHKRLFFAGPNVTDTSNVALDGIYSAAGLASVVAMETNDPALPINGLGIKGFGGTEKVLLGTEKEALATAGVTPLYSVDGVPTVYQLVTTYQKNASNQADTTYHDGTTILVADDVIDSITASLSARYGRTKYIDRILKSIRSSVMDVLDEKVGLEIIDSYKNVTVTKDPSNSYGAIIDYEMDIVTPLYKITLRQHITI